MTNEMEKLQLALAMAGKECPTCEGTRVVRVCDGGGDWQIWNCEVCHGTGKVPLLELVREKCPRCGGYGFLTEMGGDDILCSSCQGRGWIPSTDPWKWFEAVHKILDATEVAHLSWAIWEGEQIFYTALAKALGVRE